MGRTARKTTCSTRRRRECQAAKRSCRWIVRAGCRVQPREAARDQLVSYSLFGTDLLASVTGHAGMQHRIQLYILGLAENMQRIPDAFAVHVYLSANIYHQARRIFDGLLQQYPPDRLRLTVVRTSVHPNDYRGTLWRFLPLFDRQWRVVLVRDLDDGFTMTDHLARWLRGRGPNFHRQVPGVGGREEIRDTDPDRSRRRDGWDEYAISAGWVGRRSRGGSYASVAVAARSMLAHLRLDRGYCTDERWLLKAAADGLLGFKQPHPWSRVVEQIPEAGAREDLPFEGRESGRNWQTLQRRHMASLPADPPAAGLMYVQDPLIVS